MKSVVFVLFLLVPLVSATDCHVSTQRVQCGSWSCLKDKCAPCEADADCYESALYCALPAGTCQFRPMTDALGANTILAQILSIAICAVAIVAGVGGGGILVPLFSVLLGFPVGNAVGISQATIVGQSSLGVAFLLFRRHDQDVKRPVVNYQYLSLLLPLALAGTTIGVLGGKVVPDVVRIVLLFSTFLLLLKRLVKRAANQLQNRKPASTQSGEVSEGPKETPPPLEPIRWSRFRSDFVIIGSSVLFLLAGSLARSFMSCGSAGYIVFQIVPVVGLCAIFFVSWLRLRRQWGRTVEDHNAEPLDFAWGTRNSVIFPLLAIGAGAAASMLGIGGGLILGFLLFEVGLTPQEASATSSIATLLVASESALQLSLNGTLRLDYGGLFLVGGAISGLIGQKVFMQTIRAKEWHFLIVVALTLVVALSMICLVSLGIYDSAISISEGGAADIVAFGHICKKH